MDSSDQLLLKEDKLASIRRRNKVLIIIFFSLIILLALITGRTITSLVQKFNTDESRRSNRAVVQFCSPFKHRAAAIACIDSISATVHSPNADPNHIFLLSLEFSLTKINSVARSVRGPSNCLSSLSHARGQLNNILEMLRIDPDVESYDRGDMTAWIGAAATDLEACGSAEVGEKLSEVAAVVRYGRDFLIECEVVNSRFLWGWDGSRSWEDEAVEDLITVSLFGSQYLVLIFLFCLLLRIY